MYSTQRGARRPPAPRKLHYSYINIYACTSRGTLRLMVNPLLWCNGLPCCCLRCVCCLANRREQSLDRRLLYASLYNYICSLSTALYSPFIGLMGSYAIWLSDHASWSPLIEDIMTLTNITSVTCEIYYYDTYDINIRNKA